MDDELLTFQELATKCKVAPEVVERLWREGKIPGFKMTKKTVRFLWSEVVQKLRESRELRQALNEGGPPLANL